VENPLKVVLYNATGHDEELSGDKVNFKTLGKDQLLWIAGSESAVEGLKVLPDEIREALDSEPGPTNLEIFDSCYRFFVPVPDVKGAKAGTFLFIVGKACLVTVSKARPAFMDRFVDTDRGETLNGSLTPSALAATLLSEHLDDYRVAIASIDREIDKLDEAILGARETRTPLKTLATLRRRVSTLRANLGDTGSTVHALTRPDFLAHIDACDHSHFESISRTVDRLDDGIARARETIIGSFDLYTTRVAQETNQLVKCLTIATVITGIVGCAAGIFGMNFDTPFFHTGVSGFLVVTATMVVTSLVILSIAIWRRWF
jgi:Mg2+ and Co2+ transporter CorA